MFTCTYSDPKTYEGESPTSSTDFFQFSVSDCVFSDTVTSVPITYVGSDSLPIHFDSNVSTFFLDSLYVFVAVSIIFLITLTFSLAFPIFKR